MADECAEVPGGANNNNYANVMLIVDLAERYAVDAVWAGWGHASENPRLPDALAALDKRIAFIGPSSRSMRLLGDKIGSTLIAQTAGVSTIGWSGDGLKVDLDELKKREGVPDSLYQQACTFSASEALTVCRRIGFPVMIKACVLTGSRLGASRAHFEAFQPVAARPGPPQV